MMVKWLDLIGENDWICLWTLSDMQWGIVDVEIAVPLVKKPDLMFFILKPRVGQNIAMHASLTAKSLFHVLISLYHGQ